MNSAHKGICLIQSHCVKKILLPRFDTHGDIVLLQGFIQVVLERFPNAEVTLFVREGYDQLAPLFPARLKWRVQPYNPWARYSDADLEGVRKVIASVVQEPWDLVLFTTYNRTFLEDLLAASMNGAPQIALGNPPRFVKWQERAFTRLGLAHPQYDNIVPVEELSHETEKYKVYCNALFASECGVTAPRLQVPETISAKVLSVLAEMGLEPGHYVACMPAGTQNVKIKKWPEERYVEVLIWLNKVHGIMPLLFGHESEIEDLEKVAASLKTQGVEPRIWVGKDGEFAFVGGILKHARLYLGNDTGPMHIAAALSVPTLGVFGGGTWPRFTPVGEQTIAIAAVIPCYYCMWQCIFENAPCLSFVSVDDVKKAVSELLEDRVTERIVNVASALCPTALEFAGKAAEKTRTLRNEADRRQEVIDALTEALAENNEQHGKMMEALKGSLSWRITAPLRKLVDFLRR